MAAPCKGDETSPNKFREEFKRYKRRDKPCSFKDVIDFQSENIDRNSNVTEFPLKPSKEVPQLACFKPLKEWRAYELNECPGFIVIPNPFVDGYQRYWVKRCTQDYPVKPNATNLDALMQRPDNIWEACQTPDGPDLDKESFLMKLRWATLGYHFDYNKEEYFEDRKSKFPEDLACLGSYVARVLGYPQFHGEAAIVNLYRLESAMGGHTDHSELDHEAPLVSFSFGQDAVFLIGGQTKATKPAALFLHSGDISVMTGPSRLAYHAVPRMVSASLPYLNNCFTYSDSIDPPEDGDKNLKCETVKVELDVCDRCQNSVKEERENNNVTEYEGDRTIQSDLMTGHTTRKEPRDTVNISDTCLRKEKSPCSCDNEDAKKILKLNSVMQESLKHIDWAPLEKFVSVTRVNCNIRQVLRLGEEFPKKI